jgi:hypothetical protein
MKKSRKSVISGQKTGRNRGFSDFFEKEGAGSLRQQVDRKEELLGKTKVPRVRKGVA